MAAPAVLASLGKAKRENGLNVSDLTNLVTNEAETAKRATPDALGGLMGFLDQDGDGDFRDDLMEAAGKQLLGGLFGRRN